MILLSGETQKVDEVLTQGEWQQPNEAGEVNWTWQRPTRVYGFDIERPSGTIYSIQCGNEEQLMGTIPTSIIRHMKDLLMPTMKAGIMLTVRTSGFHGRIRPIGEQIL